MAAAVPGEDAWQTAEILILRHQLAVLRRRAAPPEPDLSGLGPGARLRCPWGDRLTLFALPAQATCDDILPALAPRRAVPPRPAKFRHVTGRSAPGKRPPPPTLLAFITFIVHAVERRAFRRL